MWPILATLAFFSNIAVLTSIVRLLRQLKRDAQELRGSTRDARERIVVGGMGIRGCAEAGRGIGKDGVEDEKDGTREVEEVDDEKEKLRLTDAGDEKETQRQKERLETARRLVAPMCWHWWMSPVPEDEGIGME